MAISLRALGTAIYGVANLTPAVPAGQLVGDMMICFYGTKPYSDAPTISNGWTSLGYATDGTVAAGVDVGSMQARIFYKIATADPETDPTISNSTNNVSTAVIIVFQKGASETWNTPVGAGGGDDTAGTSFSVTVSSDVGHIAGDTVVGFACFRANEAVPTTARSITITGCSLSSYVQFPSTDPLTTSGGDMSLSGGYLVVDSGTSSAAPVFNITLAANHTGSAYLSRLRVTALTAVGDTVQGIWNVREAIGDTSQAIWHVKTVIGDTIQSIWNVRQTIGDTVQGIWNVKQIVGKNSQSVWNVLTSIGDTVQAIWNVLAGLVATKDLQAVWHVRTTIGKNSQAIWNVKTVVADTCQAVWDVLATIGKTSQSIWNIRQAIGKNSQAVWNVLVVLTVIGKTLTAKWNVRVRSKHILTRLLSRQFLLTSTSSRLLELTNAETRSLNLTTWGVK